MAILHRVNLILSKRDLEFNVKSLNWLHFCYCLLVLDCYNLIQTFKTAVYLSGDGRYHPL